MAAAVAIGQAMRGASRLQEAYRRQIAPVMDDLTRCQQMADLFYSDLARGRALLGLTHPGLLRGFAAGKTMVELSNLWLFSGFFRPVMPASLAEMLRAGAR